MENLLLVNPADSAPSLTPFAAFSLYLTGKIEFDRDFAQYR